MSEQASSHEALRWSFNDQRTLGENIRLTNEPPIGRGSQGDILPAEDAEGHKYAVKLQAVAGENASPDVQKAQAAFRREGEILMKLRHPNIIHAYSTGVHKYEGVVRGRNGAEFPQTTFFDYILMDRAEYGSIADYIGKLKKDPELPPDHPRRLSPALSAAIILQTAQGLRYAHAEQDMEPNQPDPIIHSDINIRNIVLGDGQKGMKVMIADFGVSHGGDGETVLGTPLHAFSPFFASPRQIETGAVGVLDDVYSLAVTGYYLLSGEPPITPQHNYDAEAHRTQKIPPIKPASMEGREIVEELEVTLLTGMDRDEKRRFSSMGEFQADVKEGLARAETRAAKNKTYFDLATVIVDNQATTWPQKLLGAELPKVEDSAAASQADISKPEAETPQTVPHDTETEIVPNPSDTKKFRIPLPRREVLWGLVGLAAAAGAGGGIWLNEHNSPKIETPAERAEREKLDQERRAITGFAYEVVDFLNKNSHDSDTPNILREIIPYDPEGVVPHIEQVFANYNGAAAALLASYLVPYNPSGATKLMQGYLSHQKYKEALMAATRLASFSRTPAGKDGNWEAEVQNVRKAITASSLEASEQQNANKVLNAALNPAEPTAAKALQDFRDPQYEGWAVEVLAAALAPHNSEAVTAEFQWYIDELNRTQGSLSSSAYESASTQIAVLGRILAPYAPDAIAQGITRMDTSKASFARMNLAIALASYKPELTAAYIKGNDTPDHWQTHTWNMITLIALTKADPDFVRIMRARINSPPYMQWIDAGLNPLDSNARKEALDVLPTSNGLYLGDSKYVLDALLRSRQPKAQ